MGTNLTVGSPVPAVNAVATDGTRINKAWLTEKPVTVVCVWATSNYTSQSMLRQATEKAIQQEGNMRVLSICLDPSPKDAVTTLKQQSITQCTTVCDGQMLQSPLSAPSASTICPTTLSFVTGASLPCTSPATSL